MTMSPTSPPTPPTLDRLLTSERLARGAAAGTGVGIPSPADSVPTGIPAIDGVLPAGGLALGAVHEWIGVDRDPARAGAGPQAPVAVFIALAARALARRPGTLALWVGGPVQPAWMVLDGLGLLERSLFVHPRSDADQLWVLDQALRCPGVGVVASMLGRCDLGTTRRLQLAAEAGRRSGGGALGLLARDLRDGRALSAAQTRWRVHPVPAPDASRARWGVRLLRCKGMLIEPRSERHAWTLEFDPPRQFHDLEGDRDAPGVLRVAADVGDPMRRAPPSPLRPYRTA